MDRRTLETEPPTQFASSGMQSAGKRHRVEPLGHVEWMMPMDLTWVPSPHTSVGPTTS